MPRAKTILQSEFPYNITARSINKDWFNLPMPHVWRIFCEELKKVSEEKNLVVHNFVLMNNHFHMIASTPDSNISQCMHQFMYRTSRRLTRAGNRINESFAGRHYKCILQHQTYFLNAYKYNYRNPVAAGLCNRVEDYPYSTLRGKINPPELLVPISQDFLMSNDLVETLEWLNTKPSEQMLKAMEPGLKHQYFQSKKKKNTTLPIISKNDLL